MQVIVLEHVEAWSKERVVEHLGYELPMRPGCGYRANAGWQFVCTEFIGWSSYGQPEYRDRFAIPPIEYTICPGDVLTHYWSRPDADTKYARYFQMNNGPILAFPPVDYPVGSLDEAAGAAEAQEAW